MPQASPDIPSHANHQTIFDSALQAYKKKTGKDLPSTPLFRTLETCCSSDDVIVTLRQQVPALDQSGSSDDRLTRWLDPTVKVINAFSATIGGVVELSHPPAGVLFTGIGILLSAADSVSTNRGALLDLFERIENVFRRLEVYIEVPPTAGMTDSVVKVMVEVLQILAIVTKEIKQSQTFGKKLVGRTAIEDALERLKTVTEDEARTAAEAMKAIYGVGGRMQLGMQGIHDAVRDFKETNQSNDDKMKGVGDMVVVGKAGRQMATDPETIHAETLETTLKNKVVQLDDTPDDAGNSSAGSSTPPSSSSSSGDNPDGSDPPAPPSGPLSPPTSTFIARQSVPENYPQVLALPLARRPLFPGFYRAVLIRNPQVIAAVKETMKRGQPYLGVFLLKDEQADSDVITDINSVYPVGVFAQITSVFLGPSEPGKEDEKEGLTAVLYPHRRIKITDLVKPGGSQPSKVQVEEHVESPVPSDQEQWPTPPPSPQVIDPELPMDQARHHPALLQTSFLQDYDVSIVNTMNLVTQPYNKDDQSIRAFMSEIASVFKDIAQLNPLFRDQITNFSTNQVASNVFDEPDKLTDFAANVSTGELGELQDVLESLAIEDRLRKALLVLNKELNALQEKPTLIISTG